MSQCGPKKGQNFWTLFFHETPIQTDNLRKKLTLQTETVAEVAQNSSKIL